MLPAKQRNSLINLNPETLQHDFQPALSDGTFFSYFLLPGQSEVTCIVTYNGVLVLQFIVTAN